MFVTMLSFVLPIYFATYMSKTYYIEVKIILIDSDMYYNKLCPNWIIAALVFLFIS